MSRSGARNFTGTLGNANLISLAGEQACCPDATEEERIASRDLKLHARERLRSHVTEDTLGASLRRCKTRLLGSNIPSVTRQAATRSSLRPGPSVLGEPALFSLAVWVLLYLWKMLKPGLEKPKEGYGSQSYWLSPASVHRDPKWE